MEENFRIAFKALTVNKLRTILTIALIVVGITSLVGIQTAVDILSRQVAGTYSKMGAGMFTIAAKNDAAGITAAQAEEFRRRAAFARHVSAHCCLSALERVSAGGKVTDPVVTVIAADEEYLLCQNSGIAAGRNITASDRENNTGVILLGDNVRKRLFGEGVCEGAAVTVSGTRYLVAGTVARQGAVFGTGLDNSVIVPLRHSDEVSIDVIPADGLSLTEAVEKAASLLRPLRRLTPSQNPDFEIIKSNSAEDNLASVSEKLSLVALATGLITLLGAAVGLMNIMLVSVKERTREIGVRKAVGAKPSVIGGQFLAESLIIGQVGCAAGILLGVPLGNIVAILMDGDFIVPWKWMGISVVICISISLLAGFIPARMAASLDPVVALRDE